MSEADTQVVQSRSGYWAVFVESYVFLTLFAAFSLKHSFTLVQMVGQFANGMELNAFSVMKFLFLIVQVSFNLLSAYSLLSRKNLHKPPEGVQEILIPFLATFGNLFYNVIFFFPPEFNVLLIPKSYIPFFIALGAFCSILGLGVAVIALCSLRESFGIFVQVRDVVTKGLFRYMRHPMYFGHIFAELGLVLLSPRLYNFVFSVLLIALTVYRATLEEKKLSRHSTEYKQYMKKVPFLFPVKLFSKG